MSVETAPDRRAEIPDESRPETHHGVCDGTGVLADAVASSCNAGQLCIFDVIPRRSPEGLEILQAAQRCVDRVNLERRHQQRWGAYTGNPPEQYGTTSAVSDGWRLLQTATDRLQFQPVEETEPAASSRDAAPPPQPPIEEAEPAESSRDAAPRGPPRIWSLKEPKPSPYHRSTPLGPVTSPPNSEPLQMCYTKSHHGGPTSRHTRAAVANGGIGMDR